jgi:hypothetical protein
MSQEHEQEQKHVIISNRNIDSKLTYREKGDLKVTGAIMYI